MDSEHMLLLVGPAKSNTAAKIIKDFYSSSSETNKNWIHKNQGIIYAGENFEGRHASDEFFDILDKEFELMRVMEMWTYPRMWFDWIVPPSPIVEVFPNNADTVKFFRRRTAPYEEDRYRTFWRGSRVVPPKISTLGLENAV